MRQIDTRILWGVLALITIAAFLGIGVNKGWFPRLNTPASDQSVLESGENSYQNITYGIEIIYPPSFILVQNEYRPAEGLLLSISLYERDMYGEVDINGEDIPEDLPRITLQVFDNPVQYESRQWAERDERSHFTEEAERLVLTHIDGRDAFRYAWPDRVGIESVAVAKGEQIFFFTVVYRDDEDLILDDFERVLEKVVFE